MQHGHARNLRPAGALISAGLIHPHLAGYLFHDQRPPGRFFFGAGGGGRGSNGSSLDPHTSPTTELHLARVRKAVERDCTKVTVVTIREPREGCQRAPTRAMRPLSRFELSLHKILGKCEG